MTPLSWLGSLSFLAVLWGLKARWGHYHYYRKEHWFICSITWRICLSFVLPADCVQLWWWTMLQVFVPHPSPARSCWKLLWLRSSWGRWVQRSCVLCNNNNNNNNNNFICTLGGMDSSTKPKLQKWLYRMLEITDKLIVSSTHYNY